MKSIAPIPFARATDAALAPPARLPAAAVAAGPAPLWARVSAPEGSR